MILTCLCFQMNIKKKKKTQIRDWFYYIILMDICNVKNVGCPGLPTACSYVAVKLYVICCADKVRKALVLLFYDCLKFHITQYPVFTYLRFLVVCCECNVHSLTSKVFELRCLFPYFAFMIIVYVFFTQLSLYLSL